MATLSEGCYVIISVNSQKAMDVKGASDKSGANIQQWDVTKKDAQIFSAIKPENSNWAFICSLSGKAITVNGSNARQEDYDFDGSNSQRWSVVDSGSTFTYSGKSYPAYYIKLASDTSKAIEADTSATSGRYNVSVKSFSSGAAKQKWIFVQVSVFRSEQAYQIHSVSDPNLVVEIASGSTANGARAIMNANSDSDNQTFWVDVFDDFTLCFMAMHSKKYLDVKGGTAKDSVPIIQYKEDDGSGLYNQEWLAVECGTVTYNKTKYTKYIIVSKSSNNFVMDVQGGAAASNGLITYTRGDNKSNQQFFFVRAEPYAPGIPTPGGLSPTSFKRENAGTITVTDLKFASKETKFQARYKTRTYTANRASYTESDWKSIDDDSTSRHGWGDAYTATFTQNPVDGKITLPFNKTFTLSSEARSIDLYIQVRAFRSSYGDYKVAHGGTKQTIIKLRQTEVLNFAGFVCEMNDDQFGIRVGFEPLTGCNVEILRGRIIDNTGVPISEWTQVTGEETILFTAEDTLLRFPDFDDNETIWFEYALITDEEVLMSGKKGGHASNIEPSSSSFYFTEVSDDSLSVDAHGSYNGSGENCYMQINNNDRVRMVSCPKTASNAVWKVFPPIGVTTKVVYFQLLSGVVYYKSATCRVEGHSFIWNWEYEKTFDSAALLYNPSKPPQQTREYSNGLSVGNTIGSLYPIGFANANINVNMNVTGIVVDADAEIKADHEIPSNVAISAIGRLVRLSGYGIHPIYRTPYGDWYYVAVDKVSIPKNELYYTSVTVSQSVVEE